MKLINKIFFLVLAAVVLGACSDFDEINKDPNAANEGDIKVQYILNKAITDAQQDPHVAERAFALYWKRSGRHDRSGGITAGSYNNDWSTDYYNYVSGWMKSATQAVDLAEKQLENNEFASDYDRDMAKNLREVARIWRAYLMSEFADNFGPLPIDAFKGINPQFSSVKDVYYFMLKELKEASEAIDVNLAPQDSDKKFDRAYNFNFENWVRYANSMRMRFAMRLSEVDPDKAKTEFQAAVSGDYISKSSETFSVQERDGWDPLAGVMSRSWSAHLMSNTVNNLMINLGGITSASQLGSDYAAYIKPQNYLGQKFDGYFSEYTNDPSLGFFFDGLHHSIDPRAYKLYSIPGDFEHPEHYFGPTSLGDLNRKVFSDVDQENEVAAVNMAFTWNTMPGGSWGDQSAKNQIIGSNYNPIMVAKYRNHSQRRVFFGAWESYFLIAEAAVRGWSTPMSAEAAYERGIKESFEYFEISQHYNDYIESTNYNRVGTSVKWTHTTEPPASVTMTVIDGITKAPGSHVYKYPVASQTLYGVALNDALTKIITQKFLAQLPYLPLETWNDHRRLGLPFFENMVVENPLTDMPALTKTNAANSQSVQFFPQRLRYPASLQNSNPDGYNQAKDLLGGPDAVLTPLWWARQN